MGEASDWSPRLKRIAWRRGVLWWKLDANQRRAYGLIRAKMRERFATYVLNWARRTGKTRLLLTIALEEAIRRKLARIIVMSETIDALRDLTWPMLEEIVSDAPSALGIRLQEHRKRVRLANGSEIVFIGGGNRRQINRGRGRYAHAVIIEEMGTVPDLSYALGSVLGPQLLTTGGPMLAAMTPPDSPGHQSIKVLDNAKAAGNYDHCTLYDNPRLTDEEREDYLRKDAERHGMTPEEYRASAQYRREWEAEVLIDPERAFVPGFADAAVRARTLVDALEMDADVRLFADRYEAMDVGWAPHFTGVLWATWDFKRKLLCIEGEELMRRMHTGQLANAIKLRRGALWSLDAQAARVLSDTGAGRWVADAFEPNPEKPGEVRKRAGVFGRRPYLSVSDVAPQLLYDLHQLHGLDFAPTDKDDLQTAVEEVDVWLRRGWIRIDAKACPRLVVQLERAIWDTKRRGPAESAEHGHFDLVMALVYLVRNVRENSGRVPDGWGFRRDEQWVREAKRGVAGGFREFLEA